MSNRKVLIVEDEEAILKYTKNILTAQGCDVFTAVNAHDAWEIFQKEKPQACSIDLHLSFSPYEGIDLLEKIRRSEPEVICVICTTIIDQKEIDEVNRIGADGIFSKPVANEEEFKKMIELLVKGTRGGQKNG